MGNQLTGIAPSQILPVEHYLQDIPEYEYESSLGSTRFFKVAKANHGEGLVVVKVFVIHDPSLPLETYRKRLQDVESRLKNVSNVLPYQKTMLYDKAALLVRMYVKDSLYDRISTRPFLSLIEKKFIAFQLLCGLNQCHKLEVYHGDIKSENIMVTSWNWVHLTDFASFKPTYLPEDNPADFSYFFDTSRRRTCYIAPERFVESSWRDPDKETSNLDFSTTSDIQKGDLNAAMDIFSAGCVITELFTEGKPPFDLSQLLAYRSGDYAPWHLVHTIDDVYIRDLVKHMMQKDPSQRLSAEEYMIQQKGKAFPEYFYPFLKTFMQRFASAPVLSEDEKVMRIKRDWQLIMESLNISETEPEANSSLVIIISFLTSLLRSLQYEKSKLVELELLVELSKYVCADVVLDRIIPYLLFMVNDSFPQVRAEAIRSITKCVVGIKTVPLSDANIFPEYILPQISHLTQDSIVSVRVAFAENIAQLAKAASRFLEIAQLSSQPEATSGDTGSSVSTQSNASYDIELQALHEMIQQKVVAFICDPENIVKQTLLENGITQLCVFFGRQKASDVLLSHMITFLNDKRDWHLRGAFFDAIVGIASYIGWQSSAILKPLLQQGLADTEEFVIHKTLTALQTLVEMGLIKKTMKYDFLAEVKVLLCHPNLWVRQGAVGFVSAMARTMNIADVHCNLIPAIKPYLKQNVIQVSDELVLLNNLADPLSRSVFDFILRSQHIDRLFSCLDNREHVRKNNPRPGHSPNYAELDDTMSQVFRKLQSEGMTTEHEIRLLAMREFMTKLHKARASSENGSGLVSENTGVINLGALNVRTRLRHCDLMSVGNAKHDLGLTTGKKSMAKRKPGYTDSAVMNEDWKFMFGSHLDHEKSLKASKNKPEHIDSASGISDLDSFTGDSLGTITDLSLSRDSADSHAHHVSRKAAEMHMSRATEDRRSASPRNFKDSPRIQAKYASCKLNLRQLIYHKKAQHSDDQVTRDLLDNTVWESRPPPAGWKPKGLLVAHLHEHRGAVNRIQVNQEHTYFATCSNDGTVKVFDCSRMEGKSVTNRSRMTYNKQEGQIKALTFCQSCQSIASVADKGDSGSIHVFQVERSGPKYSVLHTRKLDVAKDGMVVDLTYFDTGSRNVLMYATVHGSIIGWDLRSPSKEVWKLQNDPKHGLITSFDVHSHLSWMALGTSSGTVDCWDLRFQLPVTSVGHPTNARTRRLIAHPYEPSTVITSVQGNNEISFWDLETGSRQKTLWASTAPALSQTQASAHSANGLYLARTDNNVFLLAAGSDMRVRYWDLSYPANSHIITGAATDPPHNTMAVSYRSRLVEGTEVVQETYGTYRSTSDEAPKKGHDLPPTGHHDVITDVSICQPSQCFMLTSSRDGVVKVWK